MLYDEDIGDVPVFVLEGVGDSTNNVTCNYLKVSERSRKYLREPNLSILTCNIRSCRKNFNNFLLELGDILYDFKIIVLTETWLTENIDFLFHIDGFCQFNLYRSGYGGGIKVYYDSSLNVSLATDLTFVENGMELISFYVNDLQNKFLICCLYHPPSSDHEYHNNLTDKLINLILGVAHPEMKIILCGDFNLDLFNPLRLSYIVNFMNSLLSLNFIPVITIPTKFNFENITTRYSLIDQIWVNFSVPTVISYVLKCQIWCTLCT